METEAALAVRRRTLLLAMTLEQLSVEVERDRRRPRTQGPRLRARPTTRPPNCRQLLLAQPVQQPRRRRVRRDRAKEIGLLGQRCQIGDAVAAVDQRRRQINE